MRVGQVSVENKNNFFYKSIQVIDSKIVVYSLCTEKHSIQWEIRRFRRMGGFKLGTKPFLPDTYQNYDTWIRKKVEVRE